MRYIEDSTKTLIKKLNEALPLVETPSYPCTNESIQAVLAGLTPNKNDVVISVAGSGDIPFALAPHVQKVFAIDIDPAQIDFIKQQINFLKNRNYEQFFGKGMFEENKAFLDIHESDFLRREEYFLSKLSITESALSKIELIHSNIFDFIKQANNKNIIPNKIYLSNTLSKIVCSCEEIQKLRSLPRDAFIYDVVNRPNYGGFSGFLDFEIDKEKTREVREAEKRFNPSWNWIPTVYKKIR
jgi:hypothetical protein